MRQRAVLRSPETRRRRWRWAVLVAASLLVVDTLAWVGGCWWMQDRAEAWLAEARLAGWVIEPGSWHWAGWPLSIEIAAPVDANSGPSAFPPGTVWRAERVRLRLAPWRPTRLDVLAEGPQHLSLSGWGDTTFEAASCRLAVDLTGRVAPVLDVEDLDAIGLARIGSGRFALAPDGLQVALAHVAVAHIEPEVETIDASLTMAPIPQPAASPALSASAWRDSGGTVRVTQSALRWGPVQASLVGSGRLDARLQPEADGTLTASGLPALIGRLEDAGVIAPSSALAAKAVLSILSAPAKGGPLALPVSLRAGVLSIARTPLVRLAPLAWPG